MVKITKLVAKCLMNFILHRSTAGKRNEMGGTGEDMYFTLNK